MEKLLIVLFVIFLFPIAIPCIAGYKWIAKEPFPTWLKVCVVIWVLMALGSM